MIIKIDKEFEKIIPALTDEEFKQLEENCKNNGIQDSIKLWQGLIIDGHNRYKIAEKYNLQFETEYMSFENRQDVIEWMINNQRGRRNLNNYDKGLLALKLQEILKIKGLEKMKQSGGRSKDIDEESESKTKGFEKSRNLNSAKQASKIFNVSDNTLNKVKHIEEKADNETKEKLKNNEITVNKAYTDIKKEEKKKEMKEKIKENAKKTMPINIKLLEGDMFSLIDQVKDNSIDLLCTDPPYMVLEESWDKFNSKNDFIKFTEKWLNVVIPKVKNTGRIYISFAPDYIFDLYKILEKHNFYNFNFYGQIIWSKRNNNKIFGHKGYRISFEPILYLYGQNAKDLNFSEFGEIQNNVWEIATPQSNYNEGKFHPAQKPIELYRRIISTGSKKNDLILDCFAGSGTTGIVCKQLKRNCILIEKDKNNIEIIKGRINNE